MDLIEKYSLHRSYATPYCSGIDEFFVLLPEIMMKLLHVDSSILDSDSVSRTLSAKIVSAFAAQDPALSVSHLDVASTPLDHLTAMHLAAAQVKLPASDITEDMAAGLRALDDFIAADIVVIGAPMYNFGVPSQLKAWLDRLAIAGKTFRYGEQGPVGLCAGKKVIIASSRGGVFSEGSPYASMDHQEGHLRAFFSFLGIKDIEIVRAEGLALGPEARQNALLTADQSISALTTSAT
jgi:FMN-dependent NADH-azoreductase